MAFPGWKLQQPWTFKVPDLKFSGPAELYVHTHQGGGVEPPPDYGEAG